MNKLPNLENLLLFTKSVESNSFAEVSRSLNIPKSSLSRKISQLEEDLGAQLFVRSTRNIRLTEIGQDLYNRSVAILNSIDELNSQIHSVKTEPKGDLRITTGVDFGYSVLKDIIFKYNEKCPKVTLHVELTNRLVDIVYEGIDLAIRIGIPKDSSLIAKKVGEIKYSLLASPLFLKNNQIKNYKDIEKVDCLIFQSVTNKNKTWTLLSKNEEKLIKPKPVLFSNSHSFLIECAKNGRGLIYTPRFLAKKEIESGELVPVLEKWTSASKPINVIFPNRDYLTPKTREFIDFLAVELKDRYLS